MVNGTDPTDAATLGESTDQLERAGFTGQFGTADGAIVRCFTCHSNSDASTVELLALRRVEGASDPDDMMAIAAVRCPSCGAAGTLVLRYGPESTVEDDEVLRALDDLRPSQAGGTRPVVDLFAEEVPPRPVARTTQ